MKKEQKKQITSVRLVKPGKDVKFVKVSLYTNEQGGTNNGCIFISH